ncbi:MAG: tRNA guanosine(34) transglycosylase Tgt [Clostridia bacterium]|nr:tRNA guanosine(34) transglycosylase Tgt [Clostridia bacterium]
MRSAKFFILGGTVLYKLIKQEGHARLGDFETVHGTVHMPAFMNVATTGAIRGAVSAYDLRELHCQVQLCNTYHLHLRPGDENVRALGGLQSFTGWNGPILTDSGGFQVFSLSQLRKITEEGVNFRSHIDGHKIFMGPEESMRIQSNLASTIAMAFDECVENPSPRDYVKKSSDRTVRWLKRCKSEMERLNSLENTLNRAQMLFGINQGGTYADIRVDNMKQIAGLDLNGYAIGGLAVGEPAEVMYEIIETVEPFMPRDKPRYLMGVGTPVNILEAVFRGVDLFDCVMPSRNARHGHIFTSEGVINMNNAKYRLDDRPLDAHCDCPTCRRHSRAYIHHLIKSGEMLAMRLTVMHNLYFYNTLMEKIRDALSQGRYTEFYREQREILGRRL